MKYDTFVGGMKPFQEEYNRTMSNLMEATIEFSKHEEQLKLFVKRFGKKQVRRSLKRIEEE